MRWIVASFARTPSITATVFSPIARRTSSITAGVSPSQTALIGRWKLSSAWPMSETRIGVPFLVATTMSLNSCGGIDAAERPQQQLALALLDRAAGDLDVLRDQRVAYLRNRQPVGVQLLDVDDDVDFPGAAAGRLTSPTPLTVWMTRAICLSANSVSERRLIPSDETISDITGSASGSTLVITGGRSAGGMFLIALATFSRTSFGASLISRSSTNRTVIDARPSAMRD